MRDEVPRLPAPDEVICPKAHLRSIYGNQEPYCISGTRSSPVPVALVQPEIFQKYCCGKCRRGETCRYYNTGQMSHPTLEPPQDIIQTN